MKPKFFQYVNWFTIDLVIGCYIIFNLINGVLVNPIWLILFYMIIILKAVYNCYKEFSSYEEMRKEFKK